jgi:hypothetical protein
VFLENLLAECMTITVCLRVSSFGIRKCVSFPKFIAAIFWQSRTHPLPNPKFILGETSSREQAGQEPELSALGRTASTFEEK